jgi:hypothetical protein
VHGLFSVPIGQKTVSAQTSDLRVDAGDARLTRFCSAFPAASRRSRLRVIGALLAHSVSAHHWGCSRRCHQALAWTVAGRQITEAAGGETPTPAAFVLYGQRW